MSWFDTIEGMLEGKIEARTQAEAWYLRAAESKRKHALRVMFPRTARILSKEQTERVLAALARNSRSHDWFMNHEVALEVIQGEGFDDRIRDLAQHEAILAGLGANDLPLVWQGPLNPTLVLQERLRSSLHMNLIEHAENPELLVAYWLRSDATVRWRILPPNELALLKEALREIPPERASAHEADIERVLRVFETLELMRLTEQPKV
jgi:hypothetical protein